MYFNNIILRKKKTLKEHFNLNENTTKKLQNKVLIVVSNSFTILAIWFETCLEKYQTLFHTY